MKYWEIVGGKLTAAGWTWGIVAPLHAMARCWVECAWLSWSRLKPYISTVICGTA